MCSRRTLTRRRRCDNVRNSTRKSQTAHYCLYSDDLDTNSCRFGALIAAGTVAAGPCKRGPTAVRSPFCSSADVPFGFIDLVGNNALEQLPVRSSGFHARVLRAASSWCDGMSDAMSLASKYASFGNSNFGELSFLIRRTASANPMLGRSQERRPAAIAQ